MTASGKGSMFPRGVPLVRVAIRLTADDMNVLIQMAQKNDRSPAAQARHLIRNALHAFIEPASSMRIENG